MKRKLYLALVFWLIFGSHCFAEKCGINMRAIATIESSNNPNAVNPKGDDVGLYQINPILLKEYNNFHSRKYSRRDLFNPTINGDIATWYLSVRIPSMLRAYRIPVTVKNILWAYNGGVGSVKKGRLSDITRRYFKKYRKLTGIEV